MKPNMLFRFYIDIKTSQNGGLSKVSGNFLFCFFFSKEKVITIVYE